MSTTRTANIEMHIPINAMTGSVADPSFTLGLEEPVSRCESCNEGAILAVIKEKGLKTKRV